MPGYEDKYPFVPSLLVEFRKRLSEETLIEFNEIIIASAMPKKMISIMTTTAIIPTEEARITKKTKSHRKKKPSLKTQQTT